MNDSEDQPKSESSESDAEIEREARQGRKFTLEEAISRMAGPGMMKGESLVPRQQQAEMEIDSCLRSHLEDGSGAFRRALFLRVKESDLLLNNHDQPLVVLAAYVQQVLDSDDLLTELVLEADIEWGRQLTERPHFDKPGSPPDPDDPYTCASARTKLAGLMDKLAAQSG